jgi:hypothetical protein
MCTKPQKLLRRPGSAHHKDEQGHRAEENSVAVWGKVITNPRVGVYISLETGGRPTVAHRRSPYVPQSQQLDRRSPYVPQSQQLDRRSPYVPLSRTAGPAVALRPAVAISCIGGRPLTGPAVATQRDTSIWTAGRLGFLVAPAYIFPHST